MAATTRARCRRCRKHRDTVGEITWAGYCIPCGRELYGDNVAQMIARRGPNFDRWRRSMAACVGGVLLDDSRERK